MSRHGWKGTRTYTCWEKMRSRCNNPNVPKYYLWGGRGISHDPTWADFRVFLFEMRECPAGHQLDRIDSNGNYNQINCRWVLPRDNVRNRSITKLSVRKVQLIRALLKSKHPGCSVLHFADIIAPLFGVQSDTIRKVVSGRLWPEVI